VFAIFPQWDLAIPGWFFDPVRGDFPLAIRWFPNLIRSIGHWTTLLIVLAAGGSLLAKILFPRTKALLSPRIALFLVCSFAIGPGLIVNGILKPTWARPRPVFVQEFGKQQTFEPWWKSAGSVEAIAPLSRAMRPKPFGFSRLQVSPRRASGPWPRLPYSALPSRSAACASFLAVTSQPT